MYGDSLAQRESAADWVVAGTNAPRVSVSVLPPPSLLSLFPPPPHAASATVIAAAATAAAIFFATTVESSRWRHLPRSGLGHSKVNQKPTERKVCFRRTNATSWSRRPEREGAGQMNETPRPLDRRGPRGPGVPLGSRQQSTGEPGLARHPRGEYAKSAGRREEIVAAALEVF